MYRPIRLGLLTMTLLALHGAALAQDTAPDGPGDPGEVARAAVAQLNQRLGRLAEVKKLLHEAQLGYKRATEAGDPAGGRTFGSKIHTLSQEMSELEKAIEGSIDPARALIEKALAADPKDVDLLSELANIAALRGEDAAVLDAMNRAVAAKPDDPTLRLERGLFAYKAMQWDTAIEDLGLCLEKGHEVAKARTPYVRSLVWTHRFEQAKAELEKDLARAKKGTYQHRSLSDLRHMVSDYIELWKREQALRKAEAERDDLPRVKLVTSKGEILLELFEDSAPNTVANFITLVQQGFYDGTHFHMRRRQFAVQGGCPYSRDATSPQQGKGHPGYMIPDELHPKKARAHFAGSITMAKNLQRVDAAGSQFLLTYVPAGWLNARRSSATAPPKGLVVFGRILTGFDVAKQLEIGDELERAVVLRKRDHSYEVKRKIPFR